MTWKAVIYKLRELNNSELGDMQEYAAGAWSRRNLEAMVRDLERRHLPRRPALTHPRKSDTGVMV